MSWPRRDLFAVTVDGVVLVNILALEEKNPPQLALQKGVFVGVVTDDEKKLLSEHLYDCSSEVAVLIGRRRDKRRRREGSK